MLPNANLLNISIILTTRAKTFQLMDLYILVVVEPPS